MTLTSFAKSPTRASAAAKAEALLHHSCVHQLRSAFVAKQQPAACSSEFSKSVIESESKQSVRNALDSRLVLTVVEVYKFASQIYERMHVEKAKRVCRVVTSVSKA